MSNIDKETKLYISIISDEPDNFVGDNYGSRSHIEGGEYSEHHCPHSCHQTMVNFLKWQEDRIWSVYQMDWSKLKDYFDGKYTVPQLKFMAHKMRVFTLRKLELGVVERKLAQ